MRKEVRWERMFPDELEQAFQSKPVVYLTYGLCEPHGPQNAVGLDALKAHAIAVRAAQTHGGIVAPPDYWHIHEIGGYAIWAARYVGEVERKWTTSVPPWVHFKNVVYQIRAAEQIGFQAAMLITGHYGPNWEDLKRIVELVQPMVRMRIAAIPDFEANEPGFDSDGRSGGDHAGRVETSLLWALEPDCVDVSRIPSETIGRQTGEPHATSSATKPMPTDEALSVPPYFAMGLDAWQSDRTVGERMVDDEVAWLGNKISGLLEEYEAARSGASAEEPERTAPADWSHPGLETFEAVERFWDEVIRPEFGSLRSMSKDFGVGGHVPEGSVWHAGWEVPDRS